MAKIIGRFFHSPDNDDVFKEVVVYDDNTYLYIHKDQSLIPSSFTLTESHIEITHHNSGEEDRKFLFKVVPERDEEEHEVQRFARSLRNVIHSYLFEQVVLKQTEEEQCLLLLNKS